MLQDAVAAWLVVWLSDGGQRDSSAMGQGIAAACEALRQPLHPLQLALSLHNPRHLQGWHPAWHRVCDQPRGLSIPGSADHEVLPAL